MKIKPKEEKTKYTRDLALKVFDEEEDKNFSIDEEDISLFTKKFNKFLSRSRGTRKGIS